MFFKALNPGEGAADAPPGPLLTRGEVASGSSPQVTLRHPTLQKNTYVQTKTHTYIHTYTHMYRHIHTYTDICMYFVMPACVHACMYVYMYICMHFR